jgi:hypothetical protein
VSEYRVEHYANFGTGEPWVARLMFGLATVVDVTTLANREEIRQALASVYEALADAYNDLRELRRLAGDTNAPVTEREGAYSSFYAHLWRAYKDRFQKGLPQALGYDLGFLWQNDDKFEAGAAHFVEAHPEVDPQLIDMLRDERCAWQQNLALFRNEHLEHRQQLPAAFVAPFYTLAGAELAFDNVWHAIEDITVVLLMPHLAPGIQLVEIPEAERDPARPERFGFAVPGLPTN